MVSTWCLVSEITVIKRQGVRLKKNKKKLLFFVTEDWYFCSHRLPLALAARDAGYEVLVVTRVTHHGDLIRSHGLRLINFDISRRGQNPLIELMVIKRLIDIYKKEKPDIVHHVALKPVIYGSVAARFSSQSSVVNALAGLGFLFVSKKIKARLLRPFIEVAFKKLLNAPKVRVIFQNPDDLSLLISRNILVSEKAVLIKGSGVDTSEFYVTSETNEKPLVILASRMLWDKGIGDFVEAACQLIKEGIEAKFVLVGEGDPDNPNSISHNQLLAWQSENVIEWWGKRADMQAVFSKSHIVCLPSSYGEGVPKVLIEAASCGRAIVTTNTPGCREIVKDGENGLLIPPKNPLALAIALRKLIENKQMRIKMGLRGRKIVEDEFSINKVVLQTLTLYEQIKS